MKEYIQYLIDTKEIIRATLRKQGKSYRSRDVAFLNGYLTACKDILDAINQPQKNAELQEAMSKFAERFKV